MGMTSAAKSPADLKTLTISLNTRRTSSKCSINPLLKTMSKVLSSRPILSTLPSVKVPSSPAFLRLVRPVINPTLELSSRVQSYPYFAICNATRALPVPHSSILFPGESFSNISCQNSRPTCQTRLVQ